MYFKPAIYVTAIFAIQTITCMLLVPSHHTKIPHEWSGYPYP